LIGKLLGTSLHNNKPESIKGNIMPSLAKKNAAKKKKHEEKTGKQ
jgi:hypothetical protein